MAIVISVHYNEVQLEFILSIIYADKGFLIRAMSIETFRRQQLWPQASSPSTAIIVNAQVTQSDKPVSQLEKKHSIAAGKNIQLVPTQAA